MPAKKKVNLLLRSLGGKPVSIVFKDAKAGIPMMTGILLDEDEQHYYLGESTDITVAVRKPLVQMLMDANIPTMAIDDEELPPGTKYQ
jgi:hypothetical protein